METKKYIPIYKYCIKKIAFYLYAYFAIYEASISAVFFDFFYYFTISLRKNCKNTHCAVVRKLKQSKNRCFSSANTQNSLLCAIFYFLRLILLTAAIRGRIHVFVVVFVTIVIFEFSLRFFFLHLVSLCFCFCLISSLSINRSGFWKLYLIIPKT